MGTISILERLKAEWREYRLKSNVRFDAMQSQIEDFGKRLDKYDLPAHSQTIPAEKMPKGRKSSPRKGLAKPIPILDRPAVMEAAGVGEDPR